MFDFRHFEVNYINTPFNYTGSKFKLLEQLLPLFDYSKVNFIDLFAGGGSVYTNVLDKYEKVWINDIIKDLIGIHRGLIFEGQSFVEKVKSLSPAKDNQAAYLELRAKYNQEKRADMLFALMLSCTNNLARFNQSFQFNQTFGKRSFNPKTQEKCDTFIAHTSRLKDKLYFSSESFDKIWPVKVKNCFFYIDPPYSSVNNGAGYNCYWNNKTDDEKLFNYCLKIHQYGGTFCLSNVVSDKREMSPIVINRLVDNGFNLVKLENDYQKVSRKDKEPTFEVVVRNF